ncbi:potassium transporter TrkG [Breoghania sp.]|uniref:potassium transporter TrkG n=1 Tax=Breoghania sp. TaxID=2065378 RepID=UPI002619A151|nr:potassium transporter TrkG [Breoghania sp.]MDJ0932920.1 potassium transporter TrkG [Breoghania sp.]
MACVRPSSTCLVWIVLAAFCALPLLWSGSVFTYTDAFFEAMSGLTTTGATVVVELDTAPPGVVFWRAILQWLGGRARHHRHGALGAADAQGRRHAAL